jgi:guanylate kinase
MISAPSGSGKTTLFKMVLENFKDLKPSISYTTRQTRRTEKVGKDYYFVSDEEFDEMVRKNKFIEWANVHNYKYGTPCKFIEDHLIQGNDLLFDIDVQGAKSMKKYYPDSVLIFVITPSFKILKDRLIKRTTDKPDVIDARLKTAMDEIKELKHFNYLIINDDLQKAFENLSAIITAHRLARQKDEFNFDKFIKD